MNTHEGEEEKFVIEEDFFKTLVEDAVQMEGELLWAENVNLQEDPDAAIPEGMDQRIHTAIQEAFAQRRRRRYLRAAACLFLALAVSAVTILAVSPQARAAVRRWVVQMFGGYIEYSFQKSAELPDVLPDLRLSVIPEGYEYTKTVINEGGRVLLYTELETGRYLQFGYNQMLDTTSIYLMGEITEDNEVIVNQCPGIYYQGATEEDTSMLAWVDEDAGILYTLEGFFTADEFKEIAGTIQYDGDGVKE